jgi:2'-5' RNA ligase
MDTTTALAIVIPEEFHDKINQIRSKYDRAHYRWMPHINFIFPFVSITKFDAIALDLETKLSNYNAFDVHLNVIGCFHKKGQPNATFHIKPSDDSELQKLNSVVKYCDRPGRQDRSKTKRDDFHPHVTIGQFGILSRSGLTDKLSDPAPDLIDWLGSGIKFKVNKLCLLHRSPESGDKMVVIREIFLKDN